MKIIHNRILPFGRKYYAINLFGLLFAKGPCDAVTINHEKIHTRQMRDCGFILFYLLYLIEWLVRLFQTGFDGYGAYMKISFEKEAYANEKNPRYLAARKPFAFANYY